MFRQHGDLFQMGDGRLEYFDVREPDGNIIREGNPTVAAMVSRAAVIL